MDLKPKTLEKLHQHYIGKICTILTGPINRTFSEDTNREHFVVVVEEITVDGIWGRHPNTGTSCFFGWQHFIAIFEEQILSPDNPEHAEILKQYESPPEEGDAQFVDIASLTQLASQTRKAF